jgi:hypothetical protein
MKYKFETSVTPLAAFIKAKYSADTEFNTKLITEENNQKRVIFVFESNTIDFKAIEQIYLTSFANTYHNELQTLRNLVRTLIPYSREG